MQLQLYRRWLLCQGGRGAADSYMRHRGIYHDTHKLPNLEQELASAEALRARARVPVK